MKIITSHFELRLVAATALLAASGLLRAQSAALSYKQLRYEEDYSYLRDPAQSRDSLDAVKFIPLDDSGDEWLTLGGEVRGRYEYFHDSLWGQGPQDPDGYFLLRTMLHADWHWRKAVRFFTQLKSGIEHGRNGGPRPTDEDRLDLNQAFLDMKSSGDEGPALTLRLGRQELAFGSSRLISYRESPNVRLAFDGIRAIMETGDWRVDALAVEPVLTKTGSFDDSADRHQKLWGLYAVAPFPTLPGGHLDLYYLGLKRDTARFDQGTAPEERHSVGLRLWGQASGWDYNFESVYQFGTFGSSSIAAWTVASDTGFTFAAVPFRPRLGLKADIASGDRGQNGQTLGTFNALFPRGAYFNESALIGPANLIDIHPSAELHVTQSVSVSLDWDFFWRESQHDGIYGPAVNLVRSGQTSSARYIGSQPSLRTEWRPSRHWTVAATYAHFYAGSFIQQSGPGHDVDYFSTWITYLF
jgi:hypothetical protein